TVGEELLFTTYTDNYGVTNVLGHLFKIASFYLMYKAVIETSLRKPYDTTFRALVKHEMALESANEMKARLLSIIGHDLRNPVGGIAEMSRLILNDETFLNQISVHEVMDHIYRSASQSVELLNNLLYWAKSQNETLKLEPEEFSIAEISGNIVELFKSAIQTKSLTVTVDVPPEQICADRNMITSVLRNLFSNAVKFTSRGGCITIRGRRESESIVLEIADSGVGMTAEQRKLLFAGDAAVPTRGTDGEAGTGLGLAVSRGFVRQHGGSLSVEPGLAGGSIFQMKLPIAPRVPKNAG
ncbi:MAG TPA: ATP-binding protein, partial [Spirochaetia bacterium]|nr:ATP-binding protein [Spirochaetia bacterium]